jgi:hypothetical protein
MAAGTRVKKSSRADPQWRFKKMGDVRASMMAPELAYQNLLLSILLLPQRRDLPSRSATSSSAFAQT